MIHICFPITKHLNATSSKKLLQMWDVGNFRLHVKVALVPVAIDHNPVLLGLGTEGGENLNNN